MKRIITLIIAVFALSLAFSASASAIGQVNSFTQLRTDQWIPMPNANNLSCGNNWCDPIMFRWTGTVPGKDTTIRWVDPNGNEIARQRIPGGSGATYCIDCGPWFGLTFRVQGRMPLESGNMANQHSYHFEW